MARVARPFSRVAYVLLALAALTVTVAAAAEPKPACASTTGTGPNFTGRTDLANHNFTGDAPGSLVGANFSGVNLRGASFARQDLTNARFDGADLGPGKGPVDFTEAKLTNTCFIGATLDATDFTYAIITCADFTGASLMLATFGPAQDMREGANCRTRFVGATLDVHMIAPENWGHSDFTRANFQNLSPSAFDLVGQDISGAILAYTEFSGIDMTGANLTDVDFTGATLARARLGATALNGAKFIGAKAQSASFRCASAYDPPGPPTKACPQARPATRDPSTKVDFTKATLLGADFTAANLAHARLTGAVLTGATLTGASLAQADLQASDGIQAAIVQFATFDHANFEGAGLSSVNFDGASLVGAFFKNTTLYRTTFAAATMPDASFHHAKLQSVNFGSAILQRADFGEATLLPPENAEPAVNFQCAHLGGAKFDPTTIGAANFLNAVMPGADDCCDPGPGAWCGFIDATQDTYPPTTYPTIESTANVVCPDGTGGQCSGAQWRIPGWKTTACNNDRKMQTMWSKPQCDSKPGDIVVFKDSALKRCILANLPGQTEVLGTTAEHITQVDCPGRGITDLTGLERFIRLNKLVLSSNGLTNFSLNFGTAVESNLQTLNVAHNQLTTLDLTTHPNLMFLDASDNQLVSISPNAGVAPVVVDLSHNRLNKIPGFGSWDTLVWADLSWNRLADVTNPYTHDLSRLKNATYIDLSHNVQLTIGSASALAQNKDGSGGALRSLFLACNASFDCASLGLVDGSTYSAAATSMCSRYEATGRKWIPLPHPDCPPGRASGKSRRTP
jgi:uncharacterized protein YjbI with pentapeptide repeats